MYLSLGNIVDPFDYLTRQDIYSRSFDSNLEDTMSEFLYAASKIDHICLWIDSANPDDACFKQFIAVQKDGKASRKGSFPVLLLEAAAHRQQRLWFID